MMQQTVVEVIQTTPAPLPPIDPLPALPPMPPMPPMGEMTPHIMQGPPEWAGMVAIASMVIIGLTIVLFPIARALARRLDRGGVARPLGASADTTARLERIEQAVEAMAVEVERISEGQRFITKLMHDMRSLPAGNPLEMKRPLAARIEEPR